MHQTAYYKTKYLLKSVVKNLNLNVFTIEIYLFWERI